MFQKITDETHASCSNRSRTIQTHHVPTDHGLYKHIIFQQITDYTNTSCFNRSRTIHMHHVPKDHGRYTCIMLQQITDDTHASCSKRSRTIQHTSCSNRSLTIQTHHVPTDHGLYKYIMFQQITDDTHGVPKYHGRYTCIMFQQITDYTNIMFQQITDYIQTRLDHRPLNMEYGNVSRPFCLAKIIILRHCERKINGQRMKDDIKQKENNEGRCGWHITWEIVTTRSNITHSFSHFPAVSMCVVTGLAEICPLLLVNDPFLYHVPCLNIPSDSVFQPQPIGLLLGPPSSYRQLLWCFLCHFLVCRNHSDHSIVMPICRFHPCFLQDILMSPMFRCRYTPIAHRIIIMSVVAIRCSCFTDIGHVGAVWRIRSFMARLRPNRTCVPCYL